MLEDFDKYIEEQERLGILSQQDKDDICKAEELFTLDELEGN